MTGGNTTTLKAGETERIPNAALINFAARADLLDALREGAAEQQLAGEETYWETAAKHFASYFDSAAEAFVALAKERYKVGDAETIEIGKGTLGAAGGKRAAFVEAPYFLDGETKPGWVAEPGFVYGFIAYAKSGVPIGIKIKEKGSSEYLEGRAGPERDERTRACTDGMGDGDEANADRGRPVELHGPAGRLCALRVSLEGARPYRSGVRSAFAISLRSQNRRLGRASSILRTSPSMAGGRASFLPVQISPII